MHVASRTFKKFKSVIYTVSMARLVYDWYCRTSSGAAAVCAQLKAQTHVCMGIPWATFGQPPAQCKTASTELSERAKDKAAGQKEQARSGQRSRARAWQPAALITNSRCKMFASPPAELDRGIGHNNPLAALKDFHRNGACPNGHTYSSSSSATSGCPHDQRWFSAPRACTHVPVGPHNSPPLEHASETGTSTIFASRARFELR